VDSLYPGGSAVTAPYALVVAVNEALRVLGYFEMPLDDQPPRHIWGNPDRLDEWFKAVKQRRLNPVKSQSMEAIEDAEDDYLDSDVSDLRKV